MRGNYFMYAHSMGDFSKFSHKYDIIKCTVSQLSYSNSSVMLIESSAKPKVSSRLPMEFAKTNLHL